MNSKTAIFGLLIIIVGAIGLQMSGVLHEKEQRPIKIGTSLPLTGEAASFGQQTKPGIDLAVQEINAAGGINGRMIEMVYEDDKCSTEAGIVFNKLVSVDKVTAIFGPVCSVSANAALPIAEKGGVPTLIIASAPGLTKLGTHIFRTYPSDSLQGKFAAEYAFNTLGKHSVAILFVKNDWGQGLSYTFARRFSELGGTITLSEGVRQNETNLRTELSKIKDSHPDFIYMPLQPDSGTAAVQQSKTLGLNVPIFGGDFFDNKEFVAAPQTSGVLYTIGRINLTDEFKARVKSATGKDAGFLTSLGYDGIKILAAVMEKSGTDREKIKVGLAAIAYTTGESLPEISFDSDHDLKSALFDVRIVKNGKTELYTK